jgi:hypothetical protein
MRYMLMICGHESDHEKSPEHMRTDPENFSWFEEMDRRGVLRGCNRLRPARATPPTWAYVTVDDRREPPVGRGLAAGEGTASWKARNMSCRPSCSCLC